METWASRFCLFLFFVNCCLRFNDGGFLESQINAIETIVNAMDNVGNLPGMDNSQMKSKFTKMRNVAEKIDKDATGDAVKEVGKGLTKVVKGIQSSSPVDIITGGLSVITSITELFDPKMVVLTQVLKLISAVFSLLGGSTGSEESTEDMTKRVIEKALTDAKAEELQAEVNGLKRLYSSLSNSIKAFKKAGTVTPEQTREFYTKGFRGIKFFGTMENYIDTWCDIGDAKLYDVTKKKQDELEEKASRCLLMCNLYADLSILRQIFLVDLASFLGEKNKEHESDNVLYLISEEQKLDRNIFKFLIDPIDYRDSRYVNVKFYTRCGDYPTLNAYLINLDNKMRKHKEGRYFKPSVMVCDDVHLKGNCYSYTIAQNISDLKEWNEKIKSLYVSSGFEILAYKQLADGGNKSYGPYIGPSVFGTLPKKSKWSKMGIKETKRNSNKMIRICEGENIDINKACVLIGEGNFSTLTFPNGQDWNDKVSSLTIPAGLKVYGYADKNRAGTEYGPFYGPDTISKLCDPKKWSSIRVSETTLSATTMVKICSEVNVTGICCHIPVPAKRGEYIGFKNVNNICGCAWISTSSKPITWKLKSMKIPGGIKVQLYLSKQYLGQHFGPYTGPATISRVDGSLGERHIQSFKIIKLF